MDLKDYQFPILNGVDKSFSTIKTDKVLLELAKEKGFYNGHTTYNNLFSTIFFNGGKIKLKKDLSENQLNGWEYCKGLMRSWDPKHEEKEAICSMLMSEYLNL